jgi:hypothetical protein
MWFSVSNQNDHSVVASDVASPQRRSWAQTRLTANAIDVSRIEHENLETAVRQINLRMERLETRLDDVNREIAKLAKALTKQPLSN